MKIVIDIPEKDYNEIEPFLNGEIIKGGFNLVRVLETIKNGTPLPKGHGRLIDANELEECKEMMNTISGESKYAVRMDDIRSADTIIEADKAESEDKYADYN